MSANEEYDVVDYHHNVAQTHEPFMEIALTKQHDDGLHRGNPESHCQDDTVNRTDSSSPTQYVTLQNSAGCDGKTSTDLGMDLIDSTVSHEDTPYFRNQDSVLMKKLSVDLGIDCSGLESLDDTGPGQDIGPFQNITRGSTDVHNYSDTDTIGNADTIGFQNFDSVGRCSASTDTKSVPDPDVCPRLWLCRAAITADLRPQDVLDQLIQEEAVNGDDVERMERRPTTSGRAAALLDLLLVHKGQAACRALLDALRDVYAHLYQLVTHTAVTHTHRRQFLAYVAQRKAHQGFEPCEEGEDQVDCAMQQMNLNKSEMMNLLKSELCDYYLLSLKAIRPIAWNDDVLLNMSDFYSELVILDITNSSGGLGMAAMNMTKSDVDNSQEIKDINRLFQGSNGQCRRILLEGEPGIGKSIFCSKLAFDWAQHQNTAWAQHYEYLIYLPAATFEKTMVSSIFTQILADDIVGLNSESLELSFLDPDVQSRTLLVIDAYDEAQDKNLIHDIWNGKTLRKCTMLVTSRVGQSSLLAKSLEKRCLLRGLSVEGQNSYIAQYQADCQGTVNLRADVSDAELVLGHVIYIPLYLSLLCLLLDGRDEQIPDTKTKLLQEVVSLMVARTAAKLDMEEEHLELQMESLNKFAYLSLEGNSVMHYKVISADISQIGLLVHGKSKSKLRASKNISFVHKVFQEYLAAKYLCSLEYNEMLRQLNTLHEETRLNVIIYIAGLLDIDQGKFFGDVICKDISPPDAKTHSRSHIGLQCLAESGPFEGLDDVVGGLTPQDIHICTDSCFYCLKGLGVACTSRKCHADLVLNLDDINKDMKKWDLLKRLCLRSSTITSVALRSCPLSVQDMASCVAFYLPAFPALRHVCVSCTMMSAISEDPGEEGRTQFVEACQTHPAKLFSLTLEGCNIRHTTGTQNVNGQLDLLLNGLSYLINSAMKVLILQEVTVTLKLRSTLLQKLSKHAIDLHAFCLNGLSFEFGMFRPLLESVASCITLKHFQVCNCFEFEVEDVDEANVFSLKPQTFQRTSHELPDEVFKILSNNKLDTLIVHGQQADWSLLSFSLKGSISTLTKLDISYTTFDSDDIYELQECLRQPNLKSLALRGLKTQHNAMIDILKHARHVEELDLSNNCVGTEYLFRQLCKSIGRMKHLHKLSLATCGITDDTVSSLNPVLVKGQLRFLNLEGNEIISSDDTFNRVANSISKCKMLEALKLPIADLTRTRFDGFITVFQDMKMLRQLTIITHLSPGLIEASQAWLVAGTRIETIIQSLVPHVTKVRFTILKRIVDCRTTVQFPNDYWKGICNAYT